MTIASGSESQVNTTTTGDQTAPQAIALADGGYAVVWKTPTGWSFQSYDADGTASAGEVAVANSVYTSMPTVWAALPDGRLAYAYYQNTVPPPFSTHLYFGVLNADGSESVAAIKVLSSLMPDPDTVVDLAVNANGDILLAASNYGASEGTLLSASGAVLHQVLFGSADSEHDHEGALNIRLTVSPIGNFLAIYDRGDGVQTRYLSPDGTMGAEFDTDIPTGAKVVHGDGELTAAWIEDENGVPNVAVGTTDGVSSSGWWADGDGTTPSDVELWKLADGRSLVTWTASSGGDGGGKSVMGQLVSEGVPLGDAFVINSATADDQTDVSIAALADGSFVATWQTPGLDGSGLGIASRTFDPESYTGTSDADLWYGGALNDTIIAGDGNDVLSGEEGNDSIDAGSGDDRIYGGAGNDTIDGGGGSDKYLVGGSWADWTFAEDGFGNVLLHWTDDPTYGTKTLSNIEIVVFGDDSEHALLDLLANTAPTANDDTNASDSVQEATDLYARGNVLNNDTDLQFDIGDKLRVISGSASGGIETAVGADDTSIRGTYGTLMLRADGTYFYELDYGSSAVLALRTGDVRTDVFTYTASDSLGATSDANLTITLSGKNTGARTSGDSASGVEETTLEVAYASLLANDWHPEGRAFHFLSAQGAQYGTVSYANGMVSFTPQLNYTGGGAYFYYTIEDDAGVRSTGQVYLTIAGSNDQPTTTADSLTAYEDVTAIYVPGQLTGNDVDIDGDRLTVTSVVSGSGGTAVLNSNGTISFNATPGSASADFTYTIDDGHGGTDSGTANISVIGPYNGPTANDDSFSLAGRYLLIPMNQLLANDTDPEGDTLFITHVNSVSGGDVYRIDTRDNPSIMFTATEGFTGIATFVYRVTDGVTMSEPATVSIAVSGYPLPPVITDPPVYPQPPIEWHPPIIPPIETPVGTPVGTYDPPIFIPPIVMPPIVIPPFVTPTPPVTYDIRLSVYGTHGDDLLDRTHRVYGQTTSSGNEDIYVGGGNDTVKAQAGDDSIRGDAGDDRLYGDNGRDTLVGGLGKDSLTGGRHADTFVFNAKLKTSNVDTIVDFKHDADIIALDDKIFTKLAGSLTEEQFYSKAGATKAHDKSDRIIYDSRNGKLYYDEDGSRKAHDAIHFATLSNKAALDFEDFAIV